MREICRSPAEIHKATDDLTSEIVGFIIWKTVANQQDEETHECHPPIDAVSIVAMFRRSQREMAEGMRGKSFTRMHDLLVITLVHGLLICDISSGSNTLAASLKWQWQNVANILMQHSVAVADREGLEPYLQSQIIANKIFKGLNGKMWTTWILICRNGSRVKSLVSIAMCACCILQVCLDDMLLS